MSNSRLTEFIPFVYGAEDMSILRASFPGIRIIRVPLSVLNKGIGEIPSGVKLWVDGEVDGFDGGNPDSKWADYIHEVDGYQHIDQAASKGGINKAGIESFVGDLLSQCEDAEADLISVPQLPINGSAPRTRVNKALASAAGQWKVRTKYQGRMVCPLIVTHINQYGPLPARRKVIKQVLANAASSRSNGLWVVDSSLQDHSGSAPNDKRFESLVALHSGLKKGYRSGGLIVGGPYWGMNIVLWGRRVVSHAAIGVGRRFQYFVPGGYARQAKTRIAIPPLRRWCVVKEGLQDWLMDSIEVAKKKGLDYREYERLWKHFNSYWSDVSARKQVATFYSSWLQQLATEEGDDRAEDVFEDLSTAYKIGRRLSSVETEEGPAKRPERIARQLMLHCV